MHENTGHENTGHKNTRHKNTWALVANGGRARLVKYLGDSRAREIIDFNEGQISTGELMSDRAGRSFASVGKSRSGMELHSDPVRNQERLFAQQLAGFLRERLSQGELETLLVAASPRTLGDLRSAFPKLLRDRVILESDKDLTWLTEPQLLDALFEMLNNKQNKKD